MTTQTTQTTQTVDVHQTRWGYVATDYATYQKLRRLQYLVYLSDVSKARHRRWFRKEPQNRFEKIWTRNDKHQKISYVKGGPIAEPKRNYSEFNEYYKGSYHIVKEMIQDDYFRAKYPRLKAETVQPLSLSLDEIDKLLKDAEAWLKS